MTLATTTRNVKKKLELLLCFSVEDTVEINVDFPYSLTPVFLRM